MSAAAPSTQDACVRFADIQRVLALFTEGLTGRHLHLKPIELPSAAGRGTANKQAGTASLPAPARSDAGAVAGHSIATDGANIHLPAEIADFASIRHNRGAYRIAVLHQIGYLANGTFEFDLQRAGMLMDLPASRPAGAAVSGPLARLIPQKRSADLERFFTTAARPALLRRLFVTLEDLRIDTALRRDYPGARADLDRVLGHALAARPQVASLRPLAALIESLVQYSLGADRESLLALDRSGLAAPMLDAAARMQTANASVYDSARGALAICAMLESLIRRPPRPLKRDAALLTDLPPDQSNDAPQEAGGEAGAADEGDAEAADEDFDGPGVEFRGELRPDLVYRRMRGGMPAGVAQDTADAGAGDSPLPTYADDKNAAPTATKATRARAAAHAGPRSFLYDEWDYHAQRYLKSWCRLYEHRLRGDDFGFLDEARRRNAILARQVRRQFSFIRPESWLRVHRTSDGDEIGLDSLIEAVIDRRTGHAGNEHLYIRRDRGLREVAAAFLVDMSASTDFPIPDPAAPVTASTATEHDPYIWGRFGGPIEAAAALPRRRVIDVAREALALMCDALATLGDSHAVYGFSGDGRENVEFNLIKEFDEALSPRSWAALAAMQPRRSTRMGPAIRHAAAKLKRQPMRRRVLIIVSDGYPEDRDYGPDRRDREYGIQDTAQALLEAERAGITSFCITIDPAGHDYLRRMCAEKRYLVIDDVTALPAELTKVYRALTRDSDGRRAAPRRAAAAAGAA